MNMFLTPDGEIEVYCDEEAGHPDDHIDNERGYSWKREYATIKPDFTDDETECS